MTERYCIVIPHFRHRQPLAQLLPRLAGTSLPVIVVDDASGAEVQAELRALTEAAPMVSLVTRAVNGGKGAAMITGLQCARERGFSHAISLDADGQHDPADVARLYARSQSHPEAIFSGKPSFGPDIPAARLHGRKITNTLVKLQTGSTVLQDVMCGLRVYPLARVWPLCFHIGRRTRMEFDIEIMVRACWAGIPVQYMDTRVSYPQGGTSHFRFVKDNLRLAIMHVLLTLGGLARLPSRVFNARADA